MRGARQVGFSVAILKIKSRISVVTWPSADRLAHTRDELPIHPKARPMPTHDSGRRYDYQRTLLGRPEPTQEHPEEFVSGGQSEAGVLALEHRQLLTQGKIFNQ